jgi:5'-nucleotidase
MPSYDHFSNFQKAFNTVKFHAGIYGLNDLNSNNLNLLEDCVNKTNSIWLMSNLFHVKKQYLPITKCSIMMIIESKNIKIGLIGFMYSNDLNQNLIKYVDYVHEANRLTKELKERGVNIIIALTQMSWLHDEYLAKHASNIDFIFGGSDCEYGVRQVNNCWIIKSGTNQKNLRLIEIDFNETLNKINDYSIIKVNVHS